MSEHDYYQALLTRDAKFDGKFFFGVKTTGVYCRPICPARPKRQNVEFFSSALLAEKAGYRPCLRCRPESAPESPLWQGSSALVRRAVNVLLSDEDCQNLNEEQFAARFGVGARHLRRLFQRELGKTPAQIRRDNRLNLARKLVVETDLPLADVAFSAGFDSVRRFNDAMRQRFAKTPTELRRRQAPAGSKGSIQFSLAYRPPLDWEACLGFYQRHKIGALEQFDNGCYQRWLLFRGRIGRVVVANNPARHQLEVTLTVDDVRAISTVVNAVKVMFDLSQDPVYVAAAFDNLPALAPFYRPHHGTRLARCWDRFEMAVTAILGQLVSVKRAGQLTDELIERYGERRQNPHTGQPLWLFPRPEQLAGQELQALGVPRVKKIAISRLAQQVVADPDFFSSFQDPALFKQRLLAIHGIGPWSAEYIALRAIGDTDAFPVGDAFLDKVVDARAITALSPWRGYLATVLYKHGVPS